MISITGVLETVYPGVDTIRHNTLWLKQKPDYSSKLRLKITADGQNLWIIDIAREKYWCKIYIMVVC